jgi:hypothetical protein
LYYAAVAADGSVAAYESYLRDHPSSPHVEEARLRMRAMELTHAEKAGTVAAYEAFLNRYPRGRDSDGLREVLPALQAQEKAFALAAAIMEMVPATTIDIESNSVGNGFHGFRASGLTSTPPSTNVTTAALERVARLLREGADPRLVRIADFARPGKEVLEAGVAEIWSTGSPGRIVTRDQGGMTLSEYCGQNALEAAAKLLSEHKAQ